MLFKGTPKLGPGELARRTKALGGSLNAHTAYERTVYHAVVPVRAAAELALLQADQVRNALIDPDELQRELGVIIQEARRKLDSPSAVTGETLHELLFEQHRIRRWRIGVEERLERLTRDEVAGYYHARYAPARTIVALVADIDESAGLDLLRAAWEDWRGVAEPIPPGPVETAPPTVRTRRMESDVAMVDLVLGWRGVGALDQHEPGMEMLSGVLGMGRGARLTRMLREPGTVSSIGAGHYSAGEDTHGAGQATGVFAIGAELEATRLDETLVAIGGAVRALRELGPSERELDRVRALTRMRLQRRLGRYEGRAMALVEAEAQGDVTRLDREEAELLPAARGGCGAWEGGAWGLAPDAAGARHPRGESCRVDANHARCLPDAGRTGNALDRGAHCAWHAGHAARHDGAGRVAAGAGDRVARWRVLHLAQRRFARLRHRRGARTHQRGGGTARRVAL